MGVGARSVQIALTPEVMKLYLIPRSWYFFQVEFDPTPKKWSLLWLRKKVLQQGDE